MAKEETFQDLSALGQAGPLALALHRAPRRRPRRTFEARGSHALHAQPRCAVLALARNSRGRHPPTLDQAILAEFITEGHFGHHVRRMRQTYSERIEVLKMTADKHLNGVLDVVHAGSGMRTLAWLKTWESDHDAAQHAQKLGLEVTPLSIFTTKYEQPPALILGFAGCNPAELRRGVSVLATALRSR